MKSQAKIDNWTIIKHPRYNDYVLAGNITEHKNQEELTEGKIQVTSPLLKLDLVNNTAETQNTIYTLLKEKK